ncbi:DUF2066 domain-containing protein [Frateuria aurantia]|uniref:DUF2066 domain-containing protein n=1 Tax=Frateuria aurantia (strain ATCC 33424 / DSM 6220 / KCTC 2777 / LMG 1558 / NBRC 3245 / NCIMB 13370) TaxID=767434 RepID=H8L1P1_FRAAD|nr:DUF2066 domain-containing protein [Frateuria aurantia]AFC85401.1 hypothetical protein Fraau_0932 [Frateuria aurantia DSM 6220]
MRLFALLGLAILLTISGPSLAQQLPVSPYNVQLPVADTSVATRNQAFADALGQVLVRLAGGQDLRGQPGYADALKGASGLVAQYQYQQGNDSSQGLGLQVRFDPASVRHLAQQLGTRSGQRPPVLLLVRDARGRLLDQSQLQSLAAAINQGGYEVSYADASAAPSASSLVADQSQLAATSQRYGTGLILVGQVGNDGGQWTLFNGGAAQRWSGSAAAGADPLQAAGTAAISHLGQQLNVIGNGNNSGSLWVSGLGSAQDYASLLALLRDDSAITHVDTVSVADDGILLSISSLVPLSNLSAGLTAGGRLQVAQAHAGADAALRWIH